MKISWIYRILVAQSVPLFDKASGRAFAKFLNVAKLEVSKHRPSRASIRQLLQGIKSTSKKNHLPTMSLELIYNSALTLCRELQLMPVINDDYTLTHIKIEIGIAPLRSVLFLNRFSEETPDVAGLVSIDVFRFNENRDKCTV